MDIELQGFFGFIVFTALRKFVLFESYRMDVICFVHINILMKIPYNRGGLCLIWKRSPKILQNNKKENHKFNPLTRLYFFFQINSLMHQMRDSPQPLGGSVGSIPSTFVSNKSSSGDLTALQKTLRGHGVHSTPASNLKLSESVRNAHHDGSPSITRMSKSKSYSYDLKSYNNHSSDVASNMAASSTQSTSTSNLTMPDISPSNSQFFEVMYVGKIKVSHKRVPFTFIDDALPKFKAYDTQKMKLQAEAARRVSHLERSWN